MYTDAELTFVEAAEAAAVTTRAVSLLQGDHPGWPGSPGNTKGSGPYQGLFLVVMAGEDVAAGMVVTLEHSDAAAGTFATLIALPATTAIKHKGEDIASTPVPHGARNWLRVRLSTAKKVDAFLTNAVDKHYPGVWDGSAD